ncbi:NlpC/P60 family protein [Paracoccus cavernae]|uniref:NlpC/P60 family protein n=1 Tax=Paracoccus cavernae TaxID=1571207 RepID=A0ABT8D9S1_9RHOB|nr:NlpC/P60 family protein [Paracoccus cavernae]
MGTPYLWGGNSRWGIDCSGLAQASLIGAGIACPGDSDMQRDTFPVVEGPYQRGDLLFWPGHVAMALDAGRMIHATAFVMGVIIEDIETAIARIDAGGDGPFSARAAPTAPITPPSRKNKALMPIMKRPGSRRVFCISPRRASRDNLPRKSRLAFVCYICSSLFFSPFSPRRIKG